MSFSHWRPHQMRPRAPEAGCPGARSSLGFDLSESHDQMRIPSPLWPFSMRIESAVARSREIRTPNRRCARFDSDCTSSPAHDASFNGAFTAVGGNGGDDIPLPDEGKAGGNGGKITIKASSVITPGIAIHADGGGGGTQYGTAGDGGDSTNGTGGDGGNVAPAGKGGNAGIITVNNKKDPKYPTSDGADGKQIGNPGKGGHPGGHDGTKL